MPKNEASIEINRSAVEVFDVIHDYPRRLEWDSLLRKAELCDGARRADLGVRSVCAGKWFLGGIAMKTEYISFERGEVAAVKMVNHPLFFRNFAATIRHEDIGERKSITRYIYNFDAKPKPLSAVLEPILDRILRKETRKRLASLKKYMETPGNSA
ncbi:MAG: SRPBCC family protein [Verrucomicrobia bacterium]|nr:SRPBCC family protein [Verrucomicrobiota bacterium]